MRFVALSLLLHVEAGASAGRHSDEPEIWFTPNPSSPDFQHLWSDDAPWQTAAAQVNVLGIIHEWLLAATDEQILAMANFARRRHMKLDFDVEAVLRANSGSCPHIEGFVTPGEITRELSILKRLDIHIDVMNMDGPLWNGHYGTVPSNCALSVKDLVINVAPNIAPIIAQYPDIQIYENEPVPALTNFEDWRGALTDFQAGASRVAGRQVLGLLLDMSWDTPAWIQPLKDLREFTDERTLHLGWYVDGSVYAMSNRQWLVSAAGFDEYAERTVGAIPDNVIFSTWNSYAVNNMPDIWPIGLTSGINHYFRSRTSLQAQFTVQRAQGLLTTLEDGKSVVNATINGYIPGVNFSRPLPINVVQGVVPSNAVFGQIGYRLNAECNCHGRNDVLVGTLKYQETDGGSKTETAIFPNHNQSYNGVLVSNEMVGGAIVNRVVTTPPQAFVANFGWFLVSPGAKFTFSVPAATPAGDPWYGHIFLVFGDRNHQSLTGSVFLVPDSGRVLTSTTTTGADGQFTLKKLPRIGPGAVPVFVYFAGDAAHRSVSWSPNR
jgi:hypothetical protein